MKTDTGLASFSCVALCVALTACGGEAGEPGEPGADGAPGAPGAQGPKGEDGADGVDGTDGADGDAVGTGIIYSPWLSVAFTDDPLTPDFYAEIAAPDLTLQQLGSGDIRVYLNTGTLVDPILQSLPYDAGFSDDHVSASFFEGGIFMFANFDASTVVDEEGNPVNQYRYTIIPGETIAD